MADFDDRPISVYDNLHAMNVPTTATTTMHTSTPKAKPTYGACNPYDEMIFKFSDNNKQRHHLLPNGQSQSHQQQQLQQQLVQQRLPQQVPSPMHQQQQQKQLLPHQPSIAIYSTPIKPSTATTAAAAGVVPVSTTTSAVDKREQQRPLSQHSQTELNEASQSIAAVKAALNDAKSKFFGLNGYAQDTCDAPLADKESQTYNLINNNNNSATDNQLHKPKVQIVPPARPQPKYQNIPENSAIYRQQQQQPPALPPKPQSTERQKSSSPDSNRLMDTPSPAAFSSISPSPLSGHTSFDTSTPQSPQLGVSCSPNADLCSASPTNSGLSGPSHQQQPPTAAFKQLPLNDLDGPQPSQAVYMSTTVPQNIKGSKIAGRHTPTRNSLRHSRMLVVNNKNYQGVQHPNPMNFKYPNLARWLLIFQTTIGMLLIFLAIWIFFLAPNTTIQDNPYWSGLALILAGAIGLVLVRYQRIKRHKVRENCFKFLRADSYLLSLVAVLLCVVALIMAAIHFLRLTANDTRCVSSNILLENGSCSCTFHARELENGTSYDSNGWLDEGPADTGEGQERRSYTVEYRDLSCQEVTGEWTFILGASITLNSLGFIISLLYIILLACCRTNSKRFYSSVHTSTF